MTVFQTRHSARVASHMFVSGRVQGVGFRWHTREAATRYVISGWVGNLDDGRVEIWAEGELSAVAEFTEWVRCGAPGACVTGVEMTKTDPRGLKSFSICRGA